MKPQPVVHCCCDVTHPSAWCKSSAYFHLLSVARRQSNVRTGFHTRNKCLSGKCWRDILIQCTEPEPLINNPLHWVILLVNSVSRNLIILFAAVCSKPEGWRFNTRCGEWLFSIYLILPAALGPGVYSASNRNEYQKKRNNLNFWVMHPVARVPIKHFSTSGSNSH
jgi:hypothetical protein